MAITRRKANFVINWEITVLPESPTQDHALVAIELVKSNGKHTRILMHESEAARLGKDLADGKSHAFRKSVTRSRRPSNR